MILINSLLFFAGLLLLYIGAELLVRGSSRIALMLRISPIIVGLTVVAFGTSSPEFLVSFFAAYKGNIDISVGNIVGSNIANIGLVLGFSALLRPISRLKDSIKNELIWVTAVSILFWIFAMDNSVGHFEGGILFFGIILFTVLLIRTSINNRSQQSTEDIPHVDTGWSFIDSLSNKSKVIIFLIWTIIGIIVLGYGSKVTIDSATAIAEELGISQVIIGLTMVAFGTSLPELATGIISVIKKENELLVGNVIGSNLFNILGVAGPIALFFPIPITESVIWADFPVMLAFTFLLIIVMFGIGKINRFIAGILFLGYLTYMTLIVITR
ncbi:MAG: calcium/sodium antiporter [Calditrichaeota bacterium]|nr:calcium/sodium antiporter [Calditrichota bacterium]